MPCSSIELHVLPQILQADFGASLRVMPGVELVGDPAGEAGFGERSQDWLHVEIAAVDRRESEGFALPALQVDVTDAVPEFADLLGGISAGRGQMSGIGAEIDGGVAENLTDLVG